MILIFKRFSLILFYGIVIPAKAGI